MTSIGANRVAQRPMPTLTGIHNENRDKVPDAGVRGTAPLRRNNTAPTRPQGLRRHWRSPPAHSQREIVRPGREVPTGRNGRQPAGARLSGCRRCSLALPALGHSSASCLM